MASTRKSKRKALVALLILLIILIVVMLKKCTKNVNVVGMRQINKTLEQFTEWSELSSLEFPKVTSTLHSVTQALRLQYNVLARIHLYNTAIEIVRQEEIYATNRTEWTQLSPATNIHLIHGKSEDFLDILSNISQIRTLAMPWSMAANSSEAWSSLNDFSNLLVQKYYDWVATDPLCSWIQTPGIIRKAYVITCNRTCYRDPKLTVKPVSVPAVSLHAVTIENDKALLDEGMVFPEHFFLKPPDILTYVHMIQHGIISENGEVYSRDIKIVPFGCMANEGINPPTTISDVPLFKEVFVISQYWGQAVFHRMIEVIPRISIFLEFLHRNEQILIHSPTNEGTFAELLGMLGISKTRLVTGTARARIVYLPRATLCGYANALEIQLLSKYYRDYIKKSLRKLRRDKIVLIRRSHQRRFTEQAKIEEIVESAARYFGLNYSIFPDNPTPALKEAMVMFQSAVMVVGPHGAGLSNIVFSEPGTVVIEGVCNRPHVNLCFQRTAFILGHRWHGIPSRGGCEGVVDISAPVINETIWQYLDSVSTVSA